MPALYAHNKFGKLVIPKLPNQIKNVIRTYPDAFRIGLQGPDFLFFYIFKNKITKLGVQMHHNDVYPFMEHAQIVVQKYGIDSPEYSYITGFICHFVSDNACHPDINQFMKETNCGHVEIEGDLEHLILTKDGQTPESYPMDKLVPNQKNIAKSMTPFYPQLSTDEIYHSLCMMRYVKKFFVSPKKIKRRAITLAMKCTFHYKRLNGHVITPHPNLKCRMLTQFLYHKLIRSVEEALNLIDNFTNSAFGNDTLSAQFHRDFTTPN